MVFLILHGVAFSGCRFDSVGAKGLKIESERSQKGLEYGILTFTNQPAGKRFPLVFVLHVAGETGDHYMDLLATEAAKRRVMICAANWDDWDLKGKDKGKGTHLGDLGDALNEIAGKYPADSNRLYLLGVSKGGYVAQTLIRIQPGRYRGAVFVAYGAAGWWAEKIPLQDLPGMLFIHGKEDDTFSTDQVAGDVENLRRKGARVEWLEEEKAGHEYKPEWTAKIFDWIEKKS